MIDWLLSPAPWMALLALLLVAAGVAGTVLPALPGVPLVFGGLAVAAGIDGYERVTGTTVLVLGLLTVLSFGLDFAATALGAKRVGASPLAIAGSLAGTVAGVFLGLPGIVLGPFVGAVAGELLAQGGPGRAARVGVATWVGLLVGTAAKVALVFTMLAVFAFAYFV